MSRASDAPVTASIPLSLRAAALALAFGTAHAQQAPAGGTPEASLPEIKASGTRERDNSRAATGAKFETPLRDVPQSVTVLDRQMLDTQAAASLKDALRNVPGITLGAGEGGVIGDNINLRGFSARTDIYLDGLRDRGQYTRDVFALQAIEVLKGPSSMLFGRGSTGGVINQISKQPSLKAAGEVSATVGTDDYYRVTADINRPLSETSAARIAVFGQDIQSTRDVTETHGGGVAPSIRWGIGTPTELTLALLVQRTYETPDYGFPFLPTGGTGSVRKPIDAPFDNYYGYTDDRFDQSVNVLTATLQHKLTPNATVRNRTLFSVNRTKAQPSPLGAVARIDGGAPSHDDPLDELVAPRQDRDRIVRDRSLVNQTDFTVKLDALGVKHTLTTGVELAYEESEESRYVWNTDAADRLINLGDPEHGERAGERALTRRVDTRTDTVAAYINDQVDLNEHWKLVAGVRGERFRARSDLTKFDLPADFPADTTEPATPKSQTLWSPRAGVIFQPSPTQSYYLSYGTSFNPSAETVTSSASTSELDAEKNRSIEVGAKLELLGGELSLTGAVFRIEKTDARFRDGGADAPTVVDGKIRVDGAEIGLTGNLAPNWQIFAGYTYLDGEIVDSPEIGTNADAGIAAEGKTAPNTPRHSATVWTTARLTPQWEVGGGVLYSDERWLNNYETARIDGYTRFDATVAYLQPSYEVRLNLQNLGDREYFEGSSAGRATPVRGRTALVTLTHRF